MKVSCAVAIAAGTYLGGWRVIRTLGKGLVEIESPQGMAADTSSAAIILLSSHFGYALSTTHVATGSILGSGVGKPGAEVRWGVAGRMAVGLADHAARRRASSARCAGRSANGIGGALGVTVVFAILLAACGAMYVRSRRTPINPDNVNDEWQGGLAPAPHTAPVTAGISA